MKLLSNVHTHCTWCDGADTSAAMAAAAFDLGFTDLGFSSHSPAPFDPSCPGVADEAAYRADIRALQTQYEGRMGILCGMEQDYYAPVDPAAYDYVIGSVHFLPRGEAEPYVAVDGDPDVLRKEIEARYGGDALAMAKDHLALSVESARRFKPHIVGHFDLALRHNKNNSMLNEQAPAYQKAALEALDAVADILAGYGGLFEVNTGAMARDARPIPYPAPFLLRHLAQRNARVIVTSDSHSVKTLNYAFDDMLELLRACGFVSLVVLRGGRFQDIKI